MFSALKHSIELKAKFHNVVLVFMLSSLLVLLNSCKDDDGVVNGQPPSGSIGGTITLPTAALGKQLIVVVDTDLNGDNGFSYSVSSNCGVDSIETYSFDVVTVGKYYLYAVVFVVNDGTSGPQNGDFLGFCGGSLSFPPTSPNVEITANENKICNLTMSVINW